MATNPAKTLSQVLKDHTPRLLAVPGVVGTAEGLTGDDRPCILVLASARSPQVQAIPATLDGHPVVIQVTGEIRALGDEPPGS